ncbi:MAG: thiamine pyrophosphate-binding protein [Herbiconiux sp.]|uniref:thiamine pyrophosphate-binding protein n=1 Tax=Herbiconiux sp. TaxID=1871186 RepID=UPI0012148BDB|nr:thiamine pyrophosphate-binding protein [Herbiconiux sp.]TAJ46930.1 MAG: thiamine pyrophosphate-binding protein [Herbiconiux sp.]
MSESTSELTVAARILDLLGELGVQELFGLPGVHNLPFWRDLGAGRPRIVGVRHEQTTVYAADGAARASGGLGVALTTTGPGAANAAGALGEAWFSCSPVLLIASEVSSQQRKPGKSRRLLHESPDQAAIFETISKAVYRPRTPQEVAEVLPEAVALALTFPRGPVYLDVPFDVLNMPCPPIPHPAALERAGAAEAEVRDAVEAIDAAEKVVIWVGGGAVASDAGDEVANLADALGAPVITTYGGRGILPPDHASSVSYPAHEPPVADLLREADLLLGVGSDFDAISTKAWTMPRPPKLVSINVDAADAAKDYQPDALVVADARATLEVLTPLLRRRDGAWADVPALREGVRAGLIDDPRTTSPMTLVSAVETGWPDGGRIVCDMAIGAYWVNAYARVPGVRRIQCPIGWGTLGYGLPAAIGPAAANLGPTLAIVGDGGVMYGLGELATLVQENLPVTLLIVDDGGYGMLRYDQIHDGDEERGVDLARPDFAALAESFGIPSYRMDGIDDGSLRDLLTECAAAGGPRVIWLNQTLIPPRTTSPRWND